MLIYCLAMLVDGDWIVIHTWKFESYLIMDNVKVETLIYISVDWLQAPGEPNDAYFGKSRSTSVILPTVRHPGPKGS